MYERPVVLGVRKYWRNFTSVPSSVTTEAATILPVMSTTATDSYSADRAAAALRASRAASLAAASYAVAYRRTSGRRLTNTMSSRRFWRYASSAAAVEVERCWMLVTPRSVRSVRVFWMDTTLTSAIGTTPTTSSAASTFCQNRIPPLLLVVMLFDRAMAAPPRPRRSARVGVRGVSSHAPARPSH